MLFNLLPPPFAAAFKLFLNSVFFFHKSVDLFVGGKKGAATWRGGLPHHLSQGRSRRNVSPSRINSIVPLILIIMFIAIVKYLFLLGMVIKPSTYIISFYTWKNLEGSVLLFLFCREEN